MEKLIEAWRKQAIREDQQAKECFEEGCEVYSQGHSSEAEIYSKCADELQRHLTSRRSRAADVCACTGGGWFDLNNICIGCGGTKPPPA